MKQIAIGTSLIMAAVCLLSIIYNGATNNKGSPVSKPADSIRKSNIQQQAIQVKDSTDSILKYTKKH